MCEVDAAQAARANGEKPEEEPIEIAREAGKNEELIQEEAELCGNSQTRRRQDSERSAEEEARGRRRRG